MAEKKNILTYEGLKKLEDELQDLKVNQRREIAQKIKEAREQRLFWMRRSILTRSVLAVWYVYWT